MSALIVTVLTTHFPITTVATTHLVVQQQQ